MPQNRNGEGAAAVDVVGVSASEWEVGLASHQDSEGARIPQQGHGVQMPRAAFFPESKSLL